MMKTYDTGNEKEYSSYSSALYSLWSVQDSLLQYYRSMFLTAESLLIAIGSTLAATQKPLFAWPIIVVGLILWSTWLIVTWSRARDVRFVQLLLRRSEEGKYVRSPFTTFKDYQRAWLQDSKYTIAYVNNECEEFTWHGVLPSKDFRIPFTRPWRWGTRIHMELVLPAVYVVAWVVIAFYAYRH